MRKILIKIWKVRVRVSIPDDDRLLPVTLLNDDSFSNLFCCDKVTINDLTKR